MQGPLSVGLWVTRHSGFRGAGETWQGVRPQADQVDGVGGGVGAEVRVGMSGQEGQWGAGITGAALTQLDLGAKDPKLRQGRGQGSSSLAGAGTEGPCRNPGRLPGRTDPLERDTDQSK